MPKIYHYRREFVNIRVSKRLYDFLTSQKRYHEPLDRIADRIFATTEAREALEWHHDLQDIIDNKDRTIKSLTEEVRVLKQQVKDMRLIDMKLNQFIDDR